MLNLIAPYLVLIVTYPTASRATFAKPLLKPLHFGAKQPTLALYRALQSKILFRVYIYYLLIRTRIMPSLIILPVVPLS
jgi:hypothetical protein